MMRVLKWLAILLFGVVGAAIVAGVVANEDRPTGTPGPEADALAQKIESAIHKEAWDATGAVRWSFHERHHYLWDRTRHVVRVEFGGYRAFLRPGDQSGRVWKSESGAEPTEETDPTAKQALLKKAYAYFINDSFWLNPMVNFFDAGVERGLVKMQDGSDGLLITYGSGGVTPGDSYLWSVDPSGLPSAWKMWVKIVPVGGVGNTWEGWVDLPTGAKVSTVHRVMDKPITFISNLAAAKTLSELEPGADPFAPLFE